MHAPKTAPPTRWSWAFCPGRTLCRPRWRPSSLSRQASCEPPPGGDCGRGGSRVSGPAAAAAGSVAACREAGADHSARDGADRGGRLLGGRAVAGHESGLDRGLAIVAAAARVLTGRAPGLAAARPGEPVRVPPVDRCRAPARGGCAADDGRAPDVRLEYGLDPRRTYHDAARDDL